LFAITACELITGSQARYLASDGVAGLAAAYEWVRSVVPPVDEDRPLGPEVERLIEACREGSLAGPSTR
jgi:histidine ammonia-lyase